MYVPRVCCTKWGECTDTNYDPHTHHCLCTRTNYDIHTYFSFTHTTSIHTRRGIMTRTYHFHLHTPFNTHTHTNYDSHTPLFIYTPHFNTHTHTNYDSHNHFSFTRTTLIHTRRGLQTAPIQERSFQQFAKHMYTDCVKKKLYNCILYFGPAGLEEIASYC